MKVFKSIIGGFALATLLLSLQARAGANGVHDGGGGHLWTSTAPEVKSAIDWALQEMKKGSKGVFNNLLGFDGPKVVRKDGSEVRVTGCLVIPAFCKPEEFEKSLDDGTDFPTLGWDMLQLSPLELKEDGPCPAPNETDAAGSVSSFEFGAKLCLSVSELSRTIPVGLKAQVSGVLLHEMTHLLGYGEDVAVQVQGSVVKHFDEILGKLPYASNSKFESLLVSASFSTDSAIAYVEAGEREEANQAISAAVAHLDSLKTVLPDASTDTTVEAARPELYEAVEAALFELQNKQEALLHDKSLRDSDLDAALLKLKPDYVSLENLLLDYLGRGNG